MNLGNQKIKVIILVVVLVLLVAVLGWQVVGSGDRAGVSGDVYFYDVDSGELTTEAAYAVPPLPSEGNPQRVRAHVMSCGACTEEEQYVGYLEKFSGQTLATLRDVLADRDSGTLGPGVENVLSTQNLPPEEHLVADPEELDWVPMSSSEGGQIISAAQGRCPNGPPRTCTP